MSNIPISSLPIAVALSGSEAVVMDQAGTTKTGTVSLINAANVANIPIGGLTGQALVKLSNVNYATTWKTVSGFGTVQEVDTGTGLTGGPITVTGTVALASVSTGNVLANTTGVSAAPVPTAPTAILDVIGSTQGDLLYRSATGWTALPPGTANNILTTGGPGANPSWSSVGSGTVQSVALALPSSILTVSGSPVTGTGTLTGALATQTANLVWAGPTTGSAATPTFRSLVGADLPNPSASTLGGIQSTVGASHQWVSSISTSGIPALTQPAFTDISGTATGAQLPNPTLTTLGGIEAINAVTSNWIRSINTSGVPQLSQPAFSDISGNATLAQLPSIGNNTILANISGGSSTPLASSLSAIIDGSIASTQGDILYRNASAWVALAPGTSGQVLSTGGASANPSWATISGTGTVTSVATNNGLTGGTITSTGTIGLATISTGNVLAYTGAGSGVPVATAPSAILDVIGSTEGDILYRGASNWTVLAPGTAGQQLQTGGAGSTPSWAASVTSITAGTGLTGGTITTTGTIAMALNSQVLSVQPSNPTGTTSSSPVMMGLGSTCHLTPTYSSRVYFEFFGNTSNTNATTPNGIRVAWGTGTAPINGAAATGTTVASTLTPTVITANTNVVFKNGAIITGLSPGTAYWFDIQLNSGAVSTATVAALTCNAHEVL